MEKLPISLVSVVHNPGNRLEKFIARHKDYVGEIVIIDQGSTDGTYEKAKELGVDCVVRKRKKGFSEPDREYAVSLAKYPFVLFLDDDEFVEDWEKIKSLLELDIHIFWFKRKNLVDGIDTSEILGDDMQCRLWKKGALRLSNQMHVHSEAAAGTKVLYTECEIVHERTLEQLKASNLGRNKYAGKDVVELQNRYISIIEALIKEKQNGSKR